MLPKQEKIRKNREAGGDKDELAAKIAKKETKRKFVAWTLTVTVLACMMLAGIRYWTTDRQWQPKINRPERKAENWRQVGDLLANSKREWRIAVKFPGKPLETIYQKGGAEITNDNQDELWLLLEKGKRYVAEEEAIFRMLPQGTEVYYRLNNGKNFTFEALIKTPQKQGIIEIFSSGTMLPDDLNWLLPELIGTIYWSRLIAT